MAACESVGGPARQSRVTEGAGVPLAAVARGCTVPRESESAQTWDESFGPSSYSSPARTGRGTRAVNSEYGPASQMCVARAVPAWAPGLSAGRRPVELIKARCAVRGGSFATAGADVYIMIVAQLGRGQLSDAVTVFGGTWQDCMCASPSKSCAFNLALGWVD
jgi:hypothetical protein